MVAALEGRVVCGLRSFSRRDMDIFSSGKSVYVRGDETSLGGGR
jgi:hypothetical protein